MAGTDRRLLIRLLGGTASARDTADQLLQRWPSLSELLSAPRKAIAEVGGNDVATICFTVRNILAYVTHQAIEDRPLLGNSDELGAYLRHTMAFKSSEEMRVLFLNAGNRLIRDEVIGTGTADRILFEPKEIVRRAIELRSTALILAHNHPGGCRQPSREDVETTARLIGLAKHLAIEIHDHIIVTRSGCVSLRALGHFRDN